MITKEDFDYLRHGAIKVAEYAHRGQKRIDGMCYMEHPKAVEERVDGFIEKLVALLHN